MLERLIIRNFKRFDEVEIELGQRVLFIGPNNAGKTTALQALALWDLGLKRWSEKRLGANGNGETTGPVAIGRGELVSVPVPDMHALWRDHRINRSGAVRIEIEVRGIGSGTQWSCPLEFGFANTESIDCRPSASLGTGSDLRQIVEIARSTRIAYLPPMSGLRTTEFRVDPGAISVLLGEGRTAEVLRNLCHQLAQRDDGDPWSSLVDQMRTLFGIELERPVYVAERGELMMAYRERTGARLDLTAAGRGLQQTLLLLAYLHSHRGAVMLLDEPDAHLEILRQRQIYKVLADTASERDCQLIAASHSEVLLNEAADRDVVVAFVGRPHRIDDRGTQAAKSLKSIGYEAYAQAEQRGWVLYLEGSTDLEILRAFAERLDHPAAIWLASPFVEYIGNRASKAHEHFFGLREARRDLVGVVLLDRQDDPLGSRGPLRELVWRRREIENYLCSPDVLQQYATRFVEENETAEPLFAPARRAATVEMMTECVAEFVPPFAKRDLDDRWWHDVKATDDFLDRVFEEFFERQGLPNLMRKTDYHVLAKLVPRELIDDEVVEKLDAIVDVAERARPVEL